MKNEILTKLGGNHKSTIEFIDVKNYNEVYGLYTFENDVYVLKNGEDLCFDELDKSEQKKVCDMVLKNEWKINKSLQ